MQKLVALLLIAVLAGSVTIPNVFSDDEKNTNENDNHQNNVQENENENHQNQANAQENENDDKDTKNKMHFGFSNATSFTVTLPNGTKLTFGFSNGTNPGQQISAFIHKIHEVFKQQETHAKQLIKDCREKARDATNHADRKAIMDQCKIQLKQINQQFRSEHKQLQLDFKQFREMVIGKNQENHEDSHGQKGNNIQNKGQFVPSQHGIEQKTLHEQNTVQNNISPNQHGMDEKQQHEKQNETKFQNTAQSAPNQHGMDEKQQHGKQNGKQKHGKED